MGTSSDSKNPHLTEEDIKVLVSWMEIPPNRESIYGSDKKTTIGGKPKITKSAAYAQMAAHLHAKTKKYKDLKARNMQQRWENYVKKFRETQKLELGTGMGLTPSELERGMSLPAKLEKLCPCFHRIKVVIGNRANIKPHSTVELGSIVSPSDGDHLGLEGAVPGLRVQDIADEFANDEAGSADFFKASSDTDVVDIERQDCADKPNWSTRPTICSPGTPPSSDLLQVDADLPPNPVVPSCESTVRLKSSLKRSDDAGTPKPAKRAKTTKGKKTIKKTMLTTKEKTPGQTEQNAQPPEKKPTPPSAHETRMSLSQAYAKNTEAKIGFLKAKLEEEKRQWDEKQAALKQQMLDDFEERRTARKQAVLIELIRQNKTLEKIAVFMKMAE